MAQHSLLGDKFYEEQFVLQSEIFDFLFLHFNSPANTVNKCAVCVKSIWLQKNIFFVYIALDIWIPRQSSAAETFKFQMQPKTVNKPEVHLSTNPNIQNSWAFPLSIKNNFTIKMVIRTH